jgi:glycosyltransferase involved in cell wall biosynthesis
MGRILRYYISETISKSVANSQMFNWGEVLAEKGLRTEFIIFYRSKQEMLDMTGDAKQPIIKIHVVKFFLVRNLVLFFSLLVLYLRARLKFQKIIFQSRTYSVAPSLAILSLLPGLRVIADIRGFETEKYNSKTIYTRFRLFIFDFYAKLFLICSDKIFCVSNPLVLILSGRYKLRKKEQFAVFGGVADENRFYYNEDLRAEMRKKYGVEDKVLLLYSGMLNLPWQLPEKYFDFYSSISKEQTDLFLVLLTPNVELANELKIRYKIEDTSILIKESSYPDLVKYYNMADFGLLFRKNETVNNVASPTKFSEYALCGLPVIISANIGDYSEYINTTGNGYVIQDVESIENESDSISRYIADSIPDRRKIAASSKELFSKQSQVNRLLSIYKSL